jgi:hypothetical protein
MSDTQGYMLGRLHAEDERDAAFPFALAMQMLPAKKRTRPWSGGPLLNQGAVGQCVGATGREFLTSSPVLYRKRSPSMEESYDGARSFDEWAGTPHDGSSARGLMKFYQSLGLISSYFWETDVAGTAEFVASRGPVCLGIPWDRPCFVPDNEGIIHPDGDEVGGHEILIEWWYPAHRLFLFRNHWVNRDGTPWGNVKGFPGYGLISEDDTAALIKRGGDMCAALEAA